MKKEAEYLLLPIIDQNGREVGMYRVLPEDHEVVEGFTDDKGNVWTPPTAEAYYRICLLKDVQRETIERLEKTLEKIGQMAKDNAYACDHIICYTCAEIDELASAALI